MPTYFSHENYKSFQRQLNNYGYTKLHNSSKQENTVYVRTTGDQLTDMDPVELLQLRPVFERSTLQRAKRTQSKGDTKPKKAAKKDAPASGVGRRRAEEGALAQGQGAEAVRGGPSGSHAS